VVRHMDNVGSGLLGRPRTGFSVMMWGVQARDKHWNLRGRDPGGPWPKAADEETPPERSWRCASSLERTGQMALSKRGGGEGEGPEIGRCPHLPLVTKDRPGAPRKVAFTGSAGGIPVFWQGSAFLASQPDARAVARP
jgi:hypothetical protein